MNPEKGKGALQAPIPKLTRLAENNPSHSFAQACRHHVTRTERLPGHVHFAREVCVVCGRFLRWSAKPATLEGQRSNGFRIAKLTMQEGLTPWEREFLRSVAHQPRLSPRQQEILDKLCTKYLEAKAS